MRVLRKLRISGAIYIHRVPDSDRRRKEYLSGNSQIEEGTCTSQHILLHGNLEILPFQPMLSTILKKHWLASRHFIPERGFCASVSSHSRCPHVQYGSNFPI